LWYQQISDASNTAQQNGLTTRLRRVLLQAGRDLEAQGSAPRFAQQVLMAVVALRYRPDRCFAYSLFRQIYAEPWLGEGSPHTILAAHKSIEDSLAEQSRCGHAERVARFRAFSARSTECSELSLLEVMQVLPPPFTLTEVLPVESLAALACTSRSWWAWVVGHELPELLRRLLSRDSSPLLPFSWRNGVHENWWRTSFSFKPVPESGLPSAPSPSAADKLLPPLVECPPLLEWMIDSFVYDHPPTVPAALLVKGWRDFASDARPDCPREHIQQLLYLALTLATATVTRKARFLQGNTDCQVVCFSIPSITMHDAEEGGSGNARVLELLWAAEYSSD
jgi:hypothetical protein